MAVTVTTVLRPASIGDRFMSISTLAWDSSYPANGEAVTPEQMGIGSGDAAYEIIAFPSLGYVPEYDKSAKKMKLYWVDTSVDGAPLAEVVDTTNVSAITAMVVIAISKYAA